MGKEAKVLQLKNSTHHNKKEFIPNKTVLEALYNELIKIDDMIPEDTKQRCKDNNKS